LSPPEVAPGWYEDPDDPRYECYFDGRQWTSQRRPFEGADVVRQPPGWYANDETTERYWDGRQWTESRKRDRVSRSDHSEPVQRSVSIRLVGRGSDCDIRLSDATVSTHHANLVITASGTLLRDLRSSNGTFVNRKRIDEAEIHEGDEILFGMCRTIWQGGSLNQEPLVR
jgi:hypothetical protein